MRRKLSIQNSLYALMVMLSVGFVTLVAVTLATTPL